MVLVSACSNTSIATIDPPAYDILPPNSVSHFVEAVGCHTLPAAHTEPVRALVMVISFEGDLDHFDCTGVQATAIRTALDRYAAAEGSLRARMVANGDDLAGEAREWFDLDTPHGNPSTEAHNAWVLDGPPTMISGEVTSTPNDGELTVTNTGMSQTEVLYVSSTTEWRYYHKDWVQIPDYNDPYWSCIGTECVPAENPGEGGGGGGGGGGPNGPNAYIDALCSVPSGTDSSDWVNEVWPLTLDTTGAGLTTCMGSGSAACIAASPGVWVGTVPVGIPLLGNHTATAISPPARTYELVGPWENGLISRTYADSTPHLGPYSAYRWVKVGDSTKIAATIWSGDHVMSDFDGDVYTGTSNRFTGSLLKGADITLSLAQQSFIGKAIGLCWCGKCGSS